ncbi:MAG: 1-acyl-sn-glycerol-3-phosphate acyltransferase [Planctomycetes bacterium]|nr:1-acyl-sn-glycerol-3-phosphate acyltransferase [Planctomycetota bacterium]
MHHAAMSSPIAAIVFLAILPVVWLGYAAWRWQKTSFTLLEFSVHFLATLLVRFLWRAQVAPFPFPRGTGMVLISNHRSSVDPLFFGISMHWPGHWMVAKEYCEHPKFRWFLKLAQVIPTNRGGIDTAATKTAIRYAAQGDVVGMFPEGRINITRELMLPGRPGAILVALKAKVPILPCYVEGAPYGGTAGSPLLMPARVRVRFGPLIDLSPYFDRELDNGELGQLMLRCLKEIARLARRPDFEPQIAGRQWKPASQDAILG